MTSLVAPIARILLRYVGGGLISAGVAISPETLSDPDVFQVTCFVVGVLCTAISEGWYALARKYGWAQ
jgi:catabolite regulation protein CreA